MYLFSPPELVGAMVIIFIIVLFYEGLKMGREVLMGVTLKRMNTVSAPTSTTPLLTIQQAYKRCSTKIFSNPVLQFDPSSSLILLPLFPSLPLLHFSPPILPSSLSPLPFSSPPLLPSSFSHLPFPSPLLPFSPLSLPSSPLLLLSPSLSHFQEQWPTDNHLFGPFAAVCAKGGGSGRGLSSDAGRYDVQWLAVPDSGPGGCRWLLCVQLGEVALPFPVMIGDL